MRFLLPYDGSTVARAMLRHYTDPAHRRWTTGSLILVLAAASRCAVYRRLAEARRIAGRDVSLSYRLLDCEDPVPGLEPLRRTLPRSTFVSALDLGGTTLWLQTIAAALLSGRYGTCVAIDRLPPASLRRDARAADGAAARRRRRHRAACRGAGTVRDRRDASRYLEGQS